MIHITVKMEYNSLMHGNHINCMKYFHINDSNTYTGYMMHAIFNWLNIFRSY